MSKPIDYLKSILYYFLDEYYSDGVKSIRRDFDQIPA
jgi:hypothetical protein